MYYEYHNDTERWSDGGCAAVQRQAAASSGWRALYWEHTKDVYSDFYHMPNIRRKATPTRVRFPIKLLLCTPEKASPLPEEW